MPPTTDPFTYKPDAAVTASMRRAGLVVEVGGGFQPSFEAAAHGAARVLSLRSALGTRDPYVWLDPHTMGRAVNAIAASMEAADPAAAPLFHRNTRSLDAQVASMGIDFSRTLSTCPGTALVTPDDAFSDLAAFYGLVDHIAGPGISATATGHLAQVIRTKSSVPVFGEPWVDNSGVSAVASAAHVGLRHLDTLAGPPPGGWPSGSTYFGLMEQDLGTLSSGLGCSPLTQ